ncbi:type IV conjugative transfer system protein TraL (plasmid) [Bermanella marisrubri]|uniref:Type IV conjugative transfer system protein TraL n=1 Tax=Bermanella marisrubri TaxID=207949 RepID=Q1MXI3_9GAMM|nr:type IV conjugative transfer system protein TraL [Bermanella marisrubri]EAT10689.1 hypothetical protein RED65_01893 [Oceanobacter sp. RED65] [Bermanella marisrubri]QIZ85905.1 type IV conjugative transfer system protein TraL [Bermanella marisrubri]
MAVSENYWIPRTLEDPPLFFVWEMDTAVVFLTSMIIFLLFSSPIIGFFVSLWLSKSYARVKEQGGVSLFGSFLYWYLPVDLSKRYPSFIREYVGH